MASVAVFWDVDTFPPHFEGSAQIVETLACQYGSTDSIHAYAEDAPMPPTLAACSSISVMDCSQGTSKGNMIAVDMFAYAMRTSYPATLIVISDAQMLAYAVSILRLRKYRVVVVGSAEGSRGSLKQRASEFKDWDVLIGQRRDGAHLDTLEGGKATQVDANDDEESPDGVPGHAPSIDNEQLHEALADAKVLGPSPLLEGGIEAKSRPVLIEKASLQERLPHSPLSLSFDHTPLFASPTSASSALLSDLIPATNPVPVAEIFQPTSPPPMSEAFNAELMRYRSLIEELLSFPNPSRNPKRAGVIAKLLQCNTFLHTRESLGLSGLDDCLAQGIIDLGKKVNADGTTTAWVCLGPSDSAGAPTTEIVSRNADLENITHVNPISTARVMDPVFRRLVKILQPHDSLARSHVAIMLREEIQRDWLAFSLLGVRTPKRLFTLAASEGLVVLSQGKRISLAPAWRDSTGTTQIPDSNVPPSFGNERNPQFSERAPVIAQARAMSPSERMLTMAQLVSQGVISSAPSDDTRRPTPLVPSLDVPDLAQDTTQLPSVGLSISEQSHSETLSDVTFTPLVVADPIDSSLRRSLHDATTTYSPHLPDGDRRGGPEIRVESSPRPMAGIPTCISPKNVADVSPIFRALVHILRPHDRLTRSKVASTVHVYIRQDKRTFSLRGIKKPKDLFALAASEGVVVLSETIVGGKPEQWIALAPALQTLKECTSTSEVDVSVSLEKEANALDEKRDDGSHAAVIDHAAENAGKSVQEAIVAKTQAVSSTNAESNGNGSEKQQKGGSITADIVDSIPSPSTSIVDQRLLAKLIKLVEQHGPEAERSVVACALKAANPSMYPEAGARSFKKLAKLAVDKGLVTLGHGTNHRGTKTYTISLTPRTDWQHHNPAIGSALFPARTAVVPLCTPPANGASLSQEPEQYNNGSCDTAATILNNTSAKQEKEESITDDFIEAILSPSTSMPIDNSLFAGLIGLIQKHGPEAERTVVGSGMKTSNPSIYAKAGVQNFKQFISLAVDQGLVTLGHGRSRRGHKIDTISLAPDWQIHHPATDALPSATCRDEEASSGPWEPAFGSFQTLIEEIQRHPVTQPTRSLVYANLANDPARQVLDNLEEFDGYIAQAYDAGIIDLGENYHADGTRTEWISLGPTCQHLQDSEKDSYYWPQADALVQQVALGTTSALPVIKRTVSIEGVRLGLVPAGFTPLIAVLRKFKSLGNSSPLCTAVSRELLQANPSIFQEAGCQTFMEYTHLARHAGVAVVSQSAGGHRISLL